MGTVLPDNLVNVSIGTVLFDNFKTKKSPPLIILINDGGKTVFNYLTFGNTGIGDIVFGK